MLATIALALLGAILVASTAKADNPIGCWYTGVYTVTYSWTCWDYHCVDYIPFVDGRYITYHQQYQCPDGSIHYDDATRFDACVLYVPCH